MVRGPQPMPSYSYPIMTEPSAVEFPLINSMPLSSLWLPRKRKKTEEDDTNDDKTKFTRGQKRAKTAPQKYGSSKEDAKTRQDTYIQKTIEKARHTHNKTHTKTGETQKDTKGKTKRDKATEKRRKTIQTQRGFCTRRRQNRRGDGHKKTRTFRRTHFLGTFSPEWCGPYGTPQDNSPGRVRVRVKAKVGS